MRKINLQRLFSSRKTLSLTLIIMAISILSLTVVYAALSVTLNITGSTEIAASNWDIHLENPIVRTGSVSANAPSISGNNNLSFTANLKTPGDYYEFSVDVVNDGTVDAMIDSIVKTPELTEEQSKYIKYEATYQNGNSISTKQTLKKGTRTPIIIRVEFRKDLTAADLPKTTTNLNLKLTLVYVQSDGTGSTIANNGVATDLETPSCNLTINGTTGSNGWYITRPTISINTNPGYSEITDVMISNTQISDPSTATFDNIKSKQQTSDTKGIVWYGYVKDEMGNIASCSSKTIKVDTVAPNSPTGGSISVSGSSATASLSAANFTSSDATSGNYQLRYYVVKNSSSTPSKDDSNFTSSLSFTRACGTTYYAYAIAVDNAGNKSQVYKIGMASDPANEYKDYSACTKSCGEGTKTASNECPLITATSTKSCNTQPCCGSVTYKDGTTCSRTCGGGTYNRLAYSKYDGSRCSSSDQSSGGSSCNTFDCCSSVTYQNGSTCTCVDGSSTSGQYNRLAYSKYTGERCSSRDQTSGGASCSAKTMIDSDLGAKGISGCQKFGSSYTSFGSTAYQSGKLTLCKSPTTISSCVVANPSTCKEFGPTYKYIRNCVMPQ